MNFLYCFLPSRTHPSPRCEPSIIILSLFACFLPYPTGHFNLLSGGGLTPLTHPSNLPSTRALRCAVLCCALLCFVLCCVHAASCLASRVYFSLANRSTSPKSYWPRATLSSRPQPKHPTEYDCPLSRQNHHTPPLQPTCVSRESEAKFSYSERRRRRIFTKSKLSASGLPLNDSSVHDLPGIAIATLLYKNYLSLLAFFSFRAAPLRHSTSNSIARALGIALSAAGPPLASKDQKPC